MSNTVNYEAMFSGIIGQEYNMLQKMNPLVLQTSHLVGDAVSEYSDGPKPLKIVELGGGTGITTLALLMAQQNAEILSIDSEPTMQSQAKQHLKKWTDEGRLSFCLKDALTALQAIESESVDIVASAYTLHNFLNTYRAEVIKEVFRVLKPSGQFINGDRYALDDIDAQTRVIQEEVRGFFKVLSPINRQDLLEHWILHILSDESENHVMRESIALEQMRQAGFEAITLSHRNAVNALLTAIKPNN